jgi:predicted transposase/invertase (TIGR01784 family)
MSTSPHDALFKAVFGQPEHARGALRAVMPAAVAEALDWPSLALCAGSFIDPALSERHTDLLFSLAWRDSGEAALAYLLFEHQSTSDDRMAFRLLRYLVRIWERWLADHPRADSLPVIVPIVLYHGAEPWSAPTAFDALFELPSKARAAVSPHLVRFTYLLDDLSEIPDDELRARAMTAVGRLVAACFKHARTRPDLIEILNGWGQVLRDVVSASHGLEALVLVMRYILLVNDHVEPEELQAFLERVAGSDAKDTIMTAGERLIQQGLQRGIQQGVQQGIQQGIQQGVQQGIHQGVQQGIQQGVQQGIQQGVQQGERALLLRLLRRRFGDELVREREQRVATASAEQIAAWADRMLSAASLDELLAD